MKTSTSNLYSRQVEPTRREPYSPSLNDLAGIESSLTFEHRLRSQNDRGWAEGSSGSRHYSNTSAAFSGTDSLSMTQPSEQMTVTTFYNYENEDGYGDLPEIEVRRKFRLVERSDPKYLGFNPSQKDKRPFLNAVPLVGKIPEGEYMTFVYPVSSAQVWTWIIFCIFLALAAAASFFYIRNILGSDANYRMKNLVVG